MDTYKHTHIDRINFKKYIWFYEPIIHDKQLRNTYAYGDIRNSSTNFDITLTKFLHKQHGFEPSYPKGAKYVVVLTHDIDNIYPSLGLIKYYLKRNPIKSISLFLGRIRGSIRPFLNLYDILRREKEYGGTSTFYLLVSNKDILPFYRNYINDPIIINEIIKISSEAEVGLHTGYYSYNDIRLIMQEKSIIENTIGNKIYGIRNHHLNMKIPDTWEKQSSAGFLYDSTFGYRRGFGYKSKICYPFIPYNPVSRSWIDIFELPLTIMDRGLIKLNIDTDKFFEKYKSFVNNAIKYGCFITLLWHNDLLYDPRFKKYAELYWRILDYSIETEGLLLNGIESIMLWARELIRK